MASKRKQYISNIVNYDKPTRGDIKRQPKTQETKKGRRRATFEQAYARRTTASSRARAMALYGRTKPPAGFPSGGKTFQPVPAKGVGTAKPPGEQSTRMVGTMAESIKGQQRPGRKRKTAIQRQIERINKRRAAA